jgi:hypothetical protein
VVQSVDSYSSASDSARSTFFDKQWLELFREQNPDDRSPSFPTLEEAIQAYDADFNATE